MVWKIQDFLIRCNLCDLGDFIDNGLAKGMIASIFITVNRVHNQIETGGNVVYIINRLCSKTIGAFTPKLFVPIGCFMEIKRSMEFFSKAIKRIHKSYAFLNITSWIIASKASVGVFRMNIPAMVYLIPPWADAWVSSDIKFIG